MQRSTWKLVLGALVTSHLAVALFPFRFDPPRPVWNDVSRTESGSLVFGEHNRARSRGRPAWLGAAVRESSLRIALTMRTQDVGQTGPARILTVASGQDQAALTIAQDGMDVVVRVRRPGSLPDGRPPLVVRDVVTRDRWTEVLVHVQDRDVRVRAGERTRRVEAPRTVTSTWDDPESRLSLGSEPAGGKPWRGEVRVAEVLVAGDTHDLLSDESLEKPLRYVHVPDWDWQPPAPRSTTSVALDAVRALSFVPVGGAVVLSLRRRSPRAASLMVVVLALSLTLSKLLVELRHASLTDVALHSAGGVAGVVLTFGLLRRRAGAAPVVGDRSDHSDPG